MFSQFSSQIISLAPKFTVSDLAPSTELELFNSPTLIIWSGASDNTIWGDKRANWAFRALHDQLHLKTGLGFSPAEEMELGRIQASKFDGLLADLVYCEVAGQAEYFLKTGKFVDDQIKFTLEYLCQRNLK